MGHLLEKEGALAVRYDVERGGWDPSQRPSTSDKRDRSTEVRVGNGDPVLGTAIAFR
jgi:hypothetical protein